MKVLVKGRPDPVQMVDSQGRFVAPFSIKEARDADGELWSLVDATFASAESLVEAAKRAARTDDVRIVDDGFVMPDNAAFNFAEVAGSGKVELTEALAHANAFMQERRRRS